MKIIKPLTLGLLHKTYRLAGVNRMVVTVLGFFELDAPSQPRLLVEATQWGRVMKLLPTGQALDEAMPKAAAEALVLGDACAPGGVPVRSLPVRLQAGEGTNAIDKRLMVYGDRQWRYGVLPLFAIDPPAPFTTMPLDWAHSFGGPGCNANPVGRGYDGNRLAALVGANQGAMPNVEYAGTPVNCHTRIFQPASPAPMPIDWQPRKRHAGTYDQKWLANDYPGLARDLDWRLYNQASVDQRISGWWHGGEPYRLEGMHPQKPVLQGRLPAQRVRAFALNAGAAPEALREVTLVMDTVWFLPGVSLGIAAWRGQIEVADSDGLDVQALMIAYEGADEPARPLAHYAQVMALRMDPATAPLHAFNDAQLAPAVVHAPAPPPDTAAAQARIDEVTQAFWAQSGLTPPPDDQPPKARPPLLQPPSAAAIASGDMDLTDLMAQAQALGDKAKADAVAKQALLAQQLQDLKEAQGSAAPALSAPAAPAWADVLARADGSADQRTLDALALAVPGPAGTAAADPLAQARAALALKAKARRASPVPVAPAQPLAPDVAAQLGRQVLAWVAAGVPLAGRDLAGADLRGAVLAGLDLSGCQLEYADLRDADLRGCTLRDAVLTQARLDDARLGGAVLDNANLCASQAPRASLAQASLRGVRASGAQWQHANGRGADLSGAVLDALADLTGACFDGAVLEGTVLSEAVVTASRWRGASASQCVAWKMQASAADFSNSQWQRSAVIGADLSGSRWQGARLTQVQGGSTNWTGADLSGLRAQRSSWPQGQLAGVNLSGALLSQCDLSRADLQGATLDDGCFTRSLFMQARLGRSSARRADFFQALLRKADFQGADLREASLYEAELTEIRLTDARTDGVRLDAQRRLP